MSVAVVVVVALLLIRPGFGLLLGEGAHPHVGFATGSGNALLLLVAGCAWRARAPRQGVLR